MECVAGRVGLSRPSGGHGHYKTRADHIGIMRVLILRATGQRKRVFEKKSPRRRASGFVLRCSGAQGPKIALGSAREMAGM